MFHNSSVIQYAVYMPVSYTHLDVYKRQVFTYVDLPGLTVGDRIVQSILSGITLAMATIPEEFPVILTVFLSMGAWRLAKNHSLVRSLPSVETLGEVSVLCVDKTGTITKNQMTVADTWAVSYTHLDVYKRQWESRSTRESACLLWQASSLARSNWVLPWIMRS